MIDLACLSWDEGIDLLAETNNGKFWAVQRKFRSDAEKPLTYCELSTFTSLAFVTCKDTVTTRARPPGLPDWTPSKRMAGLRQATVHS